MSRHSTTRAGFTGMTERARLKGRALQMYAGQAPHEQRLAFPAWLWTALLVCALLVFVLSVL